MNVRDVSNVVATWVGLFAAIVGGYTTINGYLAQTSKQIDERKLQTFRMVERYNNNDMVHIRTKILPLVRTNAFCQSSQRESMKLDDNEVFAFVEFFDMLGLCLESRLCDEDVAYTFFGAYANWHWPAMKSFIDSVRVGEKEFGLSRPYGYGLELLARKPVALGTCRAG
ncbi:MAG: hypothetical protein ABL907_14520 [Hyphomicrobium sp.]